MMKLLISIDIDDAAFLYDDKLADCLRQVGKEAAEIEGAVGLRTIRYENRVVGSYSIKE